VVDRLRVPPRTRRTVRPDWSILGGMVRARAAVAVGLLLVLAAFVHGTENRTEATLGDRRLDCGPAITASWLVAGTPDTTYVAGARTAAEERRAVSACGPLVQQDRVGVLGIMGAGALIALVGWTAQRESPDRRRVGRPAVRPV
jgi:hypothetical protein